VIINVYLSLKVIIDSWFGTDNWLYFIAGPGNVPLALLILMLDMIKTRFK